MGVTLQQQKRKHMYVKETLFLAPCQKNHSGTNINEKIQPSPKKVMRHATYEKGAENP